MSRELKLDERIAYSDDLNDGYRNSLSDIAIEYIEKNGLTQDEFSRKIGLSKKRTKQILEGTVDLYLVDYVEIALRLGYVAKLCFIDIEDYFELV